MSDSRLSVRIANNVKFTRCEGDEWESWVARFETRFADEKEEVWASILRDVLDGVALDVCAKLEVKACADYGKLKSALQEKIRQDQGRTTGLCGITSRATGTEGKRGCLWGKSDETDPLCQPRSNRKTASNHGPRAFHVRIVISGPPGEAT